MKLCKMLYNFYHGYRRAFDIELDETDVILYDKLRLPTRELTGSNWCMLRVDISLFIMTYSS